MRAFGKRELWSRQVLACCSLSCAMPPFLRALTTHDSPLPFWGAGGLSPGFLGHLGLSSWHQGSPHCSHLYNTSWQTYRWRLCCMISSLRIPRQCPQGSSCHLLLPDASAQARKGNRWSQAAGTARNFHNLQPSSLLHKESMRRPAPSGAFASGPAAELSRRRAESSPVRKRIGSRSATSIGTRKSMPHAPTSTRRTPCLSRVALSATSK